MKAGKAYSRLEKVSGGCELGGNFVTNREAGSLKQISGKIEKGVNQVKSFHLIELHSSKPGVD